MLKNYLLITFRNLFKYKLYSAINILGLAVGIAFFTLLLLLIRHEVSYDEFHQHSSRIYRITKFIEKSDIGERTATVPFPFGPTLKREYPAQVEEMVRIFNFQVPYHSIQHQKARYNEDRFFFADETFFEVFSYPLEIGDPTIALNRSGSVVISDRIAEKYFGKKNPIGKKIIYEEKVTLTVTGVFAPRTYASHFEFDFICSFSTLDKLIDQEIVNENWSWDPCWTYVLLSEGQSPEDLEYLLTDFIAQYFPPSFRNYVNLYLQPITEIHLYSNLEFELASNGDVSYVYIFAVIALLMLIIATINFTNLSSAKSALRAREIGIRKAIGADKLELVQQFLVEFLFISVVAILIAFILVEAIFPQLVDLSGSQLYFTQVNKLILVGSIVGSGLIIGALSSIYPAYHLSKYYPAETLTGSILPGIRSKRFRGILVVVQFVITAFLLVTTLVSFKQFSYLKNADLGFDKDNVIILPANTDAKFKFDSLKHDLLQSADVVSVTGMEEILGTGHRTHEFLPENCNCEQDWRFFPSLMVRHDFLETFRIPLIAGRTFSTANEREGFHSVIINREMARYLGWEDPSDAVGKPLRSRTGKERIVGVMENFNFESLHNQVTPFVLDMASDRFLKPFFTRYIAIRYREGKEKAALAHIRSSWYDYLPNRTFEYFYLNQRLNKMYLKELQLGEITSYFAIVAILIACLGLFGLSSFVVDLRKKEIAIRKAIGTTDWSIVLLLSKEFFLLVGMALLIAGPISYFVMENWLRSFPFRTAVGADVYLITVGIAFGVTLLTISYHTIRAAFREPVEALQI